ncbi:MAG: hypothetical protein ACK4NA_14830 [Alphaproteobacteria bacterium]
MTDKPKKPLLSVEAQAEEAVREARRAAALRANLGRRKDQSEARDDAAPAAPATGAADPHASFFEAEADAAVREARREAALRASPVQKKH